MADVKISELVAGTLADADVLPFVDDDAVETKKVSASDLRAFVLAGPAASALDMGGWAITNVGNVDGRDVSSDGAVLDSHVADVSNPHSVTAAQIGALANPATADLDMGGNQIIEVDGITPNDSFADLGSGLTSWRRVYSESYLVSTDGSASFCAVRRSADQGTGLRFDPSSSQHLVWLQSDEGAALGGAEVRLGNPGGAGVEVLLAVPGDSVRLVAGGFEASTDIVPEATGTRGLGTSALRWGSVHADLLSAGQGTAADPSVALDGTAGLFSNGATELHFASANVDVGYIGIDSGSEGRLFMGSAGTIVESRPQYTFQGASQMGMGKVGAGLVLRAGTGSGATVASYEYFSGTDWGRIEVYRAVSVAQPNLVSDADPDTGVSLRTGEVGVGIDGAAKMVITASQIECYENVIPNGGEALGSATKKWIRGYFSQDIYLGDGGRLDWNDVGGSQEFAWVDEAGVVTQISRVEIVTESGTAFSVDETRNGEAIYAANAGTITATVDQGKIGNHCRIYQDGAGQVQLAAGTGVTLHHASAFNPNTAEQNSMLYLEWKTATDVYVTGDMEAA